MEALYAWTPTGMRECRIGGAPTVYVRWMDADTEIARLRAEVEALRESLFARGAMDQPPCFACGYGGPGYYDPAKHPCAARHHAALAAGRE